MKPPRKKASGDELIRRIEAIVSYADSTNASEKPHKGLLLLFAFSQYFRTGNSSVRFENYEAPFKDMLRAFTDSKSHHPEYPFWHLQSDGLWEVFYEGRIKFRKGKDFPPRPELIRVGAVGKLPFWVERDLRKTTDLMKRATAVILERWFHRSRHAQLRTTFELRFEPDSPELESGGLI